MSDNKYIVECSNAKEWEDVKTKGNVDLGSYALYKSSYPKEPIDIDVNNGEWSRLSYYTNKKGGGEYNDYKFVTAQEYLNPVFEPLLFN